MEWRGGQKVGQCSDGVHPPLGGGVGETELRRACVREWSWGANHSLPPPPLRPASELLVSTAPGHCSVERAPRAAPRGRSGSPRFAGAYDARVVCVDRYIFFGLYCALLAALHVLHLLSFVRLQIC
jgi:hypothetical protein